MASDEDGRRRHRARLLLTVAASAVLVVAAVVAGLSLTRQQPEREHGQFGADPRGLVATPGRHLATRVGAGLGALGPGFAARRPTSTGPSRRCCGRSTAAPDPHLCGFPDATNTGVPAGVALRSVPAEVSSGPGLVVQRLGRCRGLRQRRGVRGLLVHGYVDVTGSNATIKDNAISNSGNDIDGDGVNLTGNPSNVTIENNTISSPYGNHGTSGIFAGIKDINGEACGTQVLGNNIADASTGVQIYIGLIENNYIHDSSPRLAEQPPQRHHVQRVDASR